jgi:hypothetical protein
MPALFSFDLFFSPCTLLASVFSTTLSYQCLSESGLEYVGVLWVLDTMESLERAPSATYVRFSLLCVSSDMCMFCRFSIFPLLPYGSDV